jgi:hypothetical protein
MPKKEIHIESVAEDVCVRRRNNREKYVHHFILNIDSSETYTYGDDSRQLELSAFDRAWHGMLPSAHAHIVHSVDRAYVSNTYIRTHTHTHTHTYIHTYTIHLQTLPCFSTQYTFIASA